MIDRSRGRALGAVLVALASACSSGGGGGGPGDGQAGGGAGGAAGGGGGAGGNHDGGGGDLLPVDPLLQPFCDAIVNVEVARFGKCSGLAPDIARQFLNIAPCAAW